MSPCSYISLPELNQSHMNTPIEGFFWMPRSTPNPEHPSGAMSIYKIRSVHSVDMPYTQQVVTLMHFGSCLEAVRFRMTKAMSPCSYISLPELNQSHMNTPIEGYYFWMPSSTPNPEDPSGAMSIYKIRWVHSVDMPSTNQVVILMHFGSCLEAARVRMTNAMSACSYISLPELNQSHMNTFIEGYFWMPSPTPNPEHPYGAMSIYKIRWVHSVDMPSTHQVVILMHFDSCLEAVRFRMTNAMSPCSYISLPELNQSHMNTPIEGFFGYPAPPQMQSIPLEQRRSIKSDGYIQ
jgi:hypothetical protein